MKKDPEIFIAHILECVELLEKYTKGVSRGKFFSSAQLQDSVIRRIEIIGEAVKNLPEDIKVRYPQVPWKRIAGMRDILVHEYWGIDLKLTWNVAAKEIPQLKRNILKVKRDLEKKAGK